MSDQIYVVCVYKCLMQGLIFKSSEQAILNWT